MHSLRNIIITPETMDTTSPNENDTRVRSRRNTVALESTKFILTAGSIYSKTPEIN